MRYAVSAQFYVNVTIEADSEDEITEDMVSDAVLAEHGKYPSVDVREMGDFTVLGEA